VHSKYLKALISDITTKPTELLTKAGALDHFFVVALMKYWRQANFVKKTVLFSSQFGRFTVRDQAGPLVW
jgi:hypothetical protein